MKWASPENKLWDMSLQQLKKGNNADQDKNSSSKLPKLKPTIEIMGWTENALKSLTKR